MPPIRSSNLHPQIFRRSRSTAASSFSFMATAIRGSRRSTRSSYYNSLTAANGGAEKVSEWSRIFLVPGMAHCGGGPSLDHFDMLTAIVNWVEKGAAPDFVIATGKHSRAQPPALCLPKTRSVHRNRRHPGRAQLPMPIKTATETREVRLNDSSINPPRSGSRSADHCETRRIREGHARVYKGSPSPLMRTIGLSYVNRKLSPRRPFPTPASS